MIIGQKLKEMREAKNLSQGHLEQKTGLLRCYTSRVENGHTVPSVETLEKYARALEIPLYQFFHDGKAPVHKLDLPAVKKSKAAEGKDHETVRQFAKAFSKMDDRDRGLLLAMAQGFVRRQSRTRGIDTLNKAKS